jgi:hypothetical protein
MYVTRSILAIDLIASENLANAIRVNLMLATARDIHLGS